MPKVGEPQANNGRTINKVELAAALGSLPVAAGNIAWRWRSPDRQFGILPIPDAKGVLTDYFMRRLSKMVYTVTKLVSGQEVTYTVLLLNDPQCGCQSFRRREGKDSCKHVQAMLNVVEADEQS